MAPRIYIEPEDPGDRQYPSDPDDRYHAREPADRFAFVRLLFALVIGIACAGGLYYLYQRQHAPSSGEVPLIHADPGPTKMKPPAGSNPDADQSAYSGGQAESKVERLLPPPEQPLARPTPPPTVDGLPTRTIADAPLPKAAPSTGDVAPVSPAKPSMLSAPPGAQPAVAPPLPPVPAKPPAQVAVAPPPRTPPVAAAGSFRVQIAATKDDAAAQHEWVRLQKAHNDLLGTLSPTVVRADLGDRGVFYRIQAGPIADHAAADKLCEQLKAVSIGCIVVKGQ